MRDFAGGAGYLNTASLGIPPANALAELAAATDDWAHGRTQAPEYDAWVDRARVAWARLRGIDAANVAIGPQVSYFMGIVARSLPAGRRGRRLRGRLHLGAVAVPGPRRPRT